MMLFAKHTIEMLFAKQVIEMRTNLDQLCFHRGSEVTHVVREELEQGGLVDQSEDGQGHLLYGGSSDLPRVELLLAENVICNIHHRFLLSSWYPK